ncbi:MAG: hypothetical protein AB8B57_06400 [Congregibacter sp.]
MRSHKTGAVALLLLLFVYVEASEARLIRSSGRASISRNDGQDIYYVGQDSLNAAGLTEDAYRDLVNFPSRSPKDENRGVSAVPGGIGGCVKGLQEVAVFETQEAIDSLEGEKSNFEPGSPEFADLDAQIQQLAATIANDPCEYVFEEGEPLELFGDFNMFFDIAEISYEVNWNITGNGLNLRLPGELNTAEIRTSPDGDTFFRGEGVFLNSPAPAGLDAGIYNVFVDVKLIAPGEFFLASPDLGIDWEEVCIDNPDLTATEDPIICGWNTFETSTFDPFNPQPFNAPTTYSSEIETLRIIAANDNPPATTVSAPSTFLLSLLGLLLIRRKHGGSRRTTSRTVRAD